MAGGRLASVLAQVAADHQASQFRAGTDSELVVDPGRCASTLLVETVGEGVHLVNKTTDLCLDADPSGQVTTKSCAEVSCVFNTVRRNV